MKGRMRLKNITAEQIQKAIETNADNIAVYRNGISDYAIRRMAKFFYKKMKEDYEQREAADSTASRTFEEKPQDKYDECKGVME